MANNTMLYKMPGQHKIHGGDYDYMIVDADNADAFRTAKFNGWFETTTEAKRAYDAAKTVVEDSPKVGRPKKVVEQVAGE